VLCDIEGLSYEEIADTLGVKLGTVRSRIHRGRAQLRTALDHRRPRRPAIAPKVAAPVAAAPVVAAPVVAAPASALVASVSAVVAPVSAVVASAQETAAVPPAGDL
jgi:hypothetical protein